MRVSYLGYFFDRNENETEKRSIDCTFSNIPIVQMTKRFNERKTLHKIVFKVVKITLHSIHTEYPPYSSTQKPAYGRDFRFIHRYREIT